MISIKLPHVNPVHTFKYAVNIKSYRKVVIEPYKNWNSKNANVTCREESSKRHSIDFFLFIKTYGSHGLRLQKQLKQGNTTIPSSFFEASRGLESVAIVGLLLWKWRCLNHTTILIGWSGQFCEEKINCTRGVQEIKS